MNEDSTEPDFDDPSYADISALIAGARVTEPVPDDVVARLDATLADLTAERRSAAEAGTGEPEVVVPLRRRLLAPRRLLAAAAAVLVVGGIGVGVTKVVHRDTVRADSTAAADSGTATSLPPLVTSGPADGAGGATHLEGTVPRFTTASFAQDAAGYLSVTATKAQTGLEQDLSAGTVPSALPAPTPQERSPLFGSASGSPDSPGPEGSLDTRSDSGAASDATGSLRACPGPADPGGTVTQIMLDDEPAVLVVHPATGGHSLVEAWSCDGSAVLASASIPS